MIFYHGGPITPEAAAHAAWKGRAAMVSFAHPQQIALATSIARVVALDNGAYSAWQKHKPIVDWSDYYTWAEGWLKHPTVEWAIIPDVIDGSEADNDALVAEWPHRRAQGVPVWHLHESLERLERLAADWHRIALGSSGQFADIGSLGWWQRMYRAMGVICDGEHKPLVKIHGLRMLARKIMESFPFSSCDSTSVAQNIGIDAAWRGTYQPLTKPERARQIVEYIEAASIPAIWEPRALQEVLPMLSMEP